WRPKASTMAEPSPRRLSRLLERPDAERRIGWAVVSLMGAGLVAMAALGALLIWHFIRRGRLIRERLGPPRVVRLPEIDPKPSPPRERKPESDDAPGHVSSL